MILHETPEIFLELVRATANQKKIPELYIEKDYWISRSLKRLAQSEYNDSVVFKGGTSLSKAHQILERFSEDIDLALQCERNVSENKRKTLIKNIEKTVSHGLKYRAGHPLESKHGRFRKTAYNFPTHSDASKFGQVTDTILIEVNSFADPRPAEKMPIASMIGEYLTGMGQGELVERFELKQFKILILGVERTLCEKIMCLIRAGYDENPMDEFRRLIRHFYDIALILRHQEYKYFVSNKSFGDLLSTVKDSDRKAIPGASTWLSRPLCDAMVFSSDSEFWNSVDRELHGNFKDMVYGDSLPHISEVRESLAFVRKSLPH